MISKNGPCPCGSGKQYKCCCGKASNGNGGVKNPLSSFNTLDILKNIAALTIVSGNR